MLGEETTMLATKKKLLGAIWVEKVKRKKRRTMRKVLRNRSFVGSCVNFGSEKCGRVRGFGKVLFIFGLMWSQSSSTSPIQIFASPTSIRRPQQPILHLLPLLLCFLDYD